MTESGQWANGARRAAAAGEAGARAGCTRMCLDLLACACGNGTGAALPDPCPGPVEPHSRRQDPPESPLRQRRDRRDFGARPDAASRAFLTALLAHLRVPSQSIEFPKQTYAFLRLSLCSLVAPRRSSGEKSSPAATRPRVSADGRSCSNACRCGFFTLPHFRPLPGRVG